MKTYRRLCIAAIAIFIALAAVLNVLIIKKADRDSGAYRVEAKRLADEINETGSYDLSQYPHITAVVSDGDLYRSDEHYLIIEAVGTLYRVEYTIGSIRSTLVSVNCVLGALLLMMCGLLIYLRKSIILPFGRLNNVPQELARGNLAVPIPEEKSKFLGKFTWGVNLLRESIEDSRKKELSMQRDKKLLLHRREIHLLTTRIEQKGLTVVPTKLYFKHGKVKVEIALARGRKLHDQREELKRRAESRDMERELAHR